jgi:hypothetical protein
MTPPRSTLPLLSIKEAKTRDLVPCFDGNPLHSLHNPKREAEVFASNHMAHVSRTPNLLVLGLGFGYHIEELSKIVQLKHKRCRIIVLEASAELLRLHSCYQKPLVGVEVITEKTSAELWNKQSLVTFLLEKPAVIVHGPSFAMSRDFYVNFLQRKAPALLSEWSLPLDEWNERSPASILSDAVGTVDGELGAWLRAYWECKHAP